MLLTYLINISTFRMSTKPCCYFNLLYC